MPPKKVVSKEIKSEFVECSKCEIVISPKDREKHEKVCGNQDAEHDYDFMKDDVLYTAIKEVQNKDDDLQDLGIGLQTQLLFLNPLTIKQLNFKVGENVIVGKEDNSLVPVLKIVWPFANVPLTSACLYMYDSTLPFGARVRIRRNMRPVSVASEVVVTIVDGETQNADALLEAIHRKYLSAAITENQELTVSHYCNLYKFNVSRICTGSQSIEDKLSTLSVGDVKKNYYRISHDTKFVLSGSSTGEATEKKTYISFDEIGGLKKQKTELLNATDLCDELRSFYHNNHLSPIHRILIFGPSGTGKSSMVHALCNKLKRNEFLLDAVNFQTIFTEQTELNALKKRMASEDVILHFENLDTLIAKKESSGGGLSKLHSFIKGVPPSCLIIATSSKPHNLDENLRGLFEKEIQIGVPTSDERLEILKLKLKGLPNNLSAADMELINGLCHGYTGANIASLCKEAFNLSLVRDRTSSKITVNDLKEATRFVRPSAMREVIIEIPKVYWSDIGGMKEVLKRLKQCVEWPLLHKDAFKRLGIRPPRGLLMYGPPGCCKTMIARALATESKLNFLSIKGPEIFSKWVGESERAVRDLFQRARSVAPAVIFFDEIDAIATERKSGSSGGSGVGDRVLAQLLTELDGVESLEDVILIAATNRPDIIDEALLRPGRLDNVIYVPLPDEEARKEIININLKKRSVADDVSVEELVTLTKGYSGAEVVAVIQDASMMALEESFDIEAVARRHFTIALQNVKPRISSDSVRFYEEFSKSFNKSK